MTNDKDKLQLEKIIQINTINIETENHGVNTNAWITVCLTNTLDYPIAISAAIVLQHKDETEKIELVESLEPGYNEIESVIRIEEPHFWNPKGYGEAPVYSCLVGIRALDEVQDVSQKQFIVADIDALAGRLIVNSRNIFVKAIHLPRNPSVELIGKLSQAGFNTAIYARAVSEDVRKAAENAGILLVPFGFIQNEESMYISTENPFEMAGEIVNRRLGKSDCWGVVFTSNQLESFFDEEFNLLKAYFKAKHAFITPALGFFEEDEFVRLYVCIEGESQELQIDLGIMEASTGTIHAQPFDVFVEAHQSIAVWEADNVSQVIEKTDEECIIAILKINDKTAAKAIYTLVPKSEFKLKPAKIFVERVLSEDNDITINIATDNYAPELIISNLPNNSKITDNYIELISAETYSITILNITEEDSARLIFEVNPANFTKQWTYNT